MPDWRPSPSSTAAISDTGRKEVLGQYRSPSVPENSVPLRPQAGKEFCSLHQKKRQYATKSLESPATGIPLQVLLQEPFYPSCNFPQNPVFTEIRKHSVTSNVMSQQNLPGKPTVNSAELATLQLPCGFHKPPNLFQLAMLSFLQAKLFRQGRANHKLLTCPK